MQKHPEENTITAINKLKKCYPYAAALLVYVVIERELKRYILKNRECKFRSAKIKTSRRNLNFADYIGKSDSVFIEDILTHLTLGDIAGLGIATGVNKDRNDIMHSNLYLSKDRDLSDPERQAKNVKYFETAKTHLIRVFRDYSDIHIKETEEKVGLLVFET